jgi:hypothetical protein
MRSQKFDPASCVVNEPLGQHNLNVTGCHMCVCVHQDASTTCSMCQEEPNHLPSVFHKSRTKRLTVAGSFDGVLPLLEGLGRPIGQRQICSGTVLTRTGAVVVGRPARVGALTAALVGGEREDAARVRLFAGALVGFRDGGT